MYLTQFICWIELNWDYNKITNTKRMEAYFLIAVSGILGLLLGTNTRIRNSFGRILLNNKNYSNPNNRYFINKKRFV